MPKDSMTGLDLKAVCKLLKQSGHIHGTWYRRRYPDVERTGLSSVEHYVRYGAELGRNPGKSFNTRRYLEAYPEVGERGINPLLHYVLEGQEKGYKPLPPSNDPVRRAKREVASLRTRLLSLGLTEQALAALKAMAHEAPEPAAQAAAHRELALWHMRLKTEADYRTALSYIQKARPGAHDLEFHQRLSTLELLAHHALDAHEQGLACYERAALAGEIGPDAMLARANFETTPEARFFWINQVLRRYRIPELQLLPGDDQPVYDRLAPRDALIGLDHGPKVTVLLAAYKAADVIGTALRSLQAQTWHNLEIIVIDDCSPDDGATCAVVEQFAREDPRIQLLRMETNGGAYVARNHGLDLATGEFVTIHDADDWSHPLKIETQARYLEEAPEVMGCLSEQARARNDLSFQRWTGQGRLVIQNTSSFMFRRAPVCSELGYWDTVRFAADSEFIRRITRVFGKNAVVQMPTGPLSFQRDSETSVVADDIKGMNGFYFGVRKEYFDAQQHHHATAGRLRYENDAQGRPFPVPAMMQPHREAFGAAHHVFDVIFMGDFRILTPEVSDAVEQIGRLQASGQRVGLVERHAFAPEIEHTQMAEPMRALIDGRSVVALVYGDQARCRKLVSLKNFDEAEDHRYVPAITEGSID